MSNSDDDKTRIKSHKSDAADRTRVGAKKSTPTVTAEGDKTRIAPQKKASARKEENTQVADQGMRKAASSADKTRIAPSKKMPQSDSDVTRFKPAPKKPSTTVDTQTTIPDPIPNFDPTSATPMADNSAAQQNGILKQRFILEKVLGRGGMGVVYKAKDLLKVEAQDREPYVAIKVLNDEFKAHPEAFIALQRESRKTVRIAHPNIVNVHDFDKDGDTVFMTMEYLEGQPLDQLIRQYKSTGLPTDDAWAILKDVSKALVHAHAEEIIHSDFKPGNIFVSNKGTAKVFDFGIARAVSKVEKYDSDPEDRTVFDAGNLGALTPPYASLEMLEGEVPDVRDDLYALGCVAYELFTGEHPFKKIPADEARRQNLKPKRINYITKRQWKAIEKALAFKREDRIASVEAFLVEITATQAKYMLPVSLALFLLGSVAVYFLFVHETPAGFSEDDIRSELEFQIRLENYRETIDQLIASPVFSSAWEGDLWLGVQAVRKLLESSDKWLQSTSNLEFKELLTSSVEWRGNREAQVYTLYLNKIRDHRESKKLDRAAILIENAYRYAQTQDELDEEKRLLASAIELAEQRRQQAFSKPVKVKPEPTVEPKLKTTAQLRDVQFDTAYANVKRQLQCQSNKLDMRNLDAAIEKLRSLNAVGYKRLEDSIIKSLVACITKIGKSFPERAAELKKSALRMFKANSSIAGIKIVPRDPCDQSIAGLGRRGKRATCRDKVSASSSGPTLVVVPSKGSIKMFAIGKYEISAAELNKFCKTSSTCAETKTQAEDLPATNVTLDQVEAYLSWLSKKTKRKYRLPTKTEWVYAAKASRVSLDPNRNCKLNTRGITKGSGLVKVTTGAQNGWGLVSYVGNAREWVYDKGRKLVAVGGSYDVSMQECDISTVASHTGQADVYTGFRVLREMRQ